MSGDTTKIKTLPCFVEYDGEQVGFTDTPIEFSAEAVKKEITADQNGEEVLLEIVQGNNLTVSFTMKEFNRTVIDKMFVDAGIAESYTGGTCSDTQYKTQETCELNSETWTAADTPVLGFGSSNRGKNLVTLAKPLKLVPIDESEKNNIVYIWKASPTPGGIAFSGVDETLVEVELRAYEDTTKPTSLSKGFIGDPAKLPSLLA